MKIMLAWISSGAAFLRLTTPNGTSSAASCAGTSGESSGDCFVHGLYGPNSTAIQSICPTEFLRLALVKHPPLLLPAITPQSSIFSPSNVIGHQPPSHFRCHSSDLSSPSFNSFTTTSFFPLDKSLIYWSPQTDQLSTSANGWNDFQSLGAAGTMASTDRNPELNRTVLRSPK